MRFSNKRKQQIVHVRDTTPHAQSHPENKIFQEHNFNFFIFDSFFILRFYFYLHLYYFVRNHKRKSIFLFSKKSISNTLSHIIPFQILVIIKFSPSAFTLLSQTSIPNPLAVYITIPPSLSCSPFTTISFHFFFNSMSGYVM